MNANDQNMYILSGCLVSSVTPLTLSVEDINICNICR